MNMAAARFENDAGAIGRPIVRVDLISECLSVDHRSARLGYYTDDLAVRVKGNLCCIDPCLHDDTLLPTLGDPGDPRVVGSPADGDHCCRAFQIAPNRAGRSVVTSSRPAGRRTVPARIAAGKSLGSKRPRFEEPPLGGMQQATRLPAHAGAQQLLVAAIRVHGPDRVIRTAQ